MPAGTIFASPPTCCTYCSGVGGSALAAPVASKAMTKNTRDASMAQGRREPTRDASRPATIFRSCLVMDHDNSARRGVDAVGLERELACGAKPMPKMRRQDERHSRLQGHETIATLQPSLTLPLEHRDGLEIGMGVKGRFVTWRRRLDAD